MKSNKWNKGKLNDGTPNVHIVSDALILQKNFADGKSIPLIIIDTSRYPEINKSIELHTGVKSGDVKLTWGKTPDDKYILLQIEAICPVQIKYFIVFDTDKHGGLLDTICKCHLLFIQCGKPEDRLSHDLSKPKLLVEIPKSSFEVELHKLTHKAKAEQFKKLGVKGRELETVVKEFDNEWNEFLSTRFK